MIEGNFFAKIKSYFTLGLANFAVSSINAVFWMYLASLLDITEYGQLGFLISLSTVAFAISTIGLDKVIIVFGSKKENVLGPSYTLGIISASVTSLIVYIITQNIGVSFLTWCMMIFLLHQSDLNSKKRFSSFAKFQILRSVLIVILGITLFHVFGINGIVLGFALSTLPTFRSLFSYAKNKKLNIGILKPKIKFMINNWLARLGNNFFWWGDKLIIGTFFGFSILGSYQLASQYLFLLDAIPRALMIYLLPQESVGQKNKKLKIFSVGISCIIALISIIVFPFVIEEFFPKYHDSILPAQIMSIAIIPITIYTLLETQFVGKEMPRVVTISTGSQVLAYFSLIILLGNEYGIMGIAFAFLSSAIIRAAVNTIIGKTNVGKYKV